MANFSSISIDAFNAMQLEAGMLLRTFNPASPTDPDDDDIICTTTGGINVSCVPTYSDLGEDVDNCPNNTMELKHLDGWDSTMAFTSLNFSPASLKLALGVADIDTSDPSKVTPRGDLKQTDFSDLWWVGNRVDGGVAAALLKNGLSTSGLVIQTTKNGKGQISVTLTGHTSIASQTTMPMEFYSAAPEDTMSLNNTETYEAE